MHWWILHCGKSTFDRQSNALPFIFETEVSNLVSHYRLGEPPFFSSKYSNKHQNEHRQCFFSYVIIMDAWFHFICSQLTHRSFHRLEVQRINIQQTKTSDKKLNMLNELAHNRVEESSFLCVSSNNGIIMVGWFSRQ